MQKEILLAFEELNRSIKVCSSVVKEHLKTNNTIEAPIDGLLDSETVKELQEDGESLSSFLVFKYAENQKAALEGLISQIESI